MHYWEENFNVFYCTVCHICKSVPSDRHSSKFCSGCKLVQYCCKSHQKIDWPNHKDFCKCVKHILSRSGTDHVFKEARDFTEKQDIDSWSKLRMSVLKLASLILKRPLSRIEDQILFFPPVCSFCYVYEANRMFPCATCNTVMYCSLEHERSDKRHKSICKSLSLSFTLDMIRFKQQRYVSCFTYLIQTCCVLNDFPQNMETFLRLGKVTLTDEDIMHSELLSYFLTVIYTILYVSKITKNGLTLHIVGADNIEELACNTLPIVFHFLPHLTRLEIVLVGPDMLYSVPVPTEINNKCSIYTSNSLYHEYVTSDSFVRPDIIAAFNCGFSQFDEPDEDSWKDSLPYILDFPNCTVISTSFISTEATSDLKRLCELKKTYVNYEVLRESEINPYSSLYPHRDSGMDDGGIFYVNKYISVLKT